MIELKASLYNTLDIKKEVKPENEWNLENNKSIFVFIQNL